MSGGYWGGFSVVGHWCVFAEVESGLWGVPGMVVVVGRGW